MSVTNGICWYPSNRVQDVRALDTKVFQVKETGEVFSSYEEYLARMRSLKGNHTASQGGGRNGLTLEKANREDGSTDVLVAKVGTYHLCDGEKAFPRPLCGLHKLF